jgi:prolyl-tRNA synthetase
MSTRTIGGLIMTHADDDGMIVPPKIAPYQVVILPFLLDDADKPQILEACADMKQKLLSAGISVRIDLSEGRASDKMWAAIKKGVPIRLEIGKREIEEGQVTFTRRDLGKDGKAKVATDDCAKSILDALDQMQKDLLERARERLNGFIKDVDCLEDLYDFFADEKDGGVKIDYALIKDSEEFEAIKKEFSVTTRCLPFADKGKKVIVAKAY